MRRTVQDAMVVDVKLSDVGATVGELRGLFADDHVHSAVLVDGGVLVNVIDREDLLGRPDDLLAATLARRDERVVTPDCDLEVARRALLVSGRRRLAVSGPDGRFHGLLCLKRTRAGFCSDQDVRDRGCSHPSEKEYA